VGIPVPVLVRFGLIVGTVLLLIGFWPLLWGAVKWLLKRWFFRTLLVLAGLACLACAVWAPAWLARPYALWMRIGDRLGGWNARLLMGILFYGIFTPLGAVLRLIGYDPLRVRPEPDTRSFLHHRQARPGSHMDHQF